MNFLSDFGVNPLLLAAQVVNFLILLFLLKKFLYGPILKVLDTRKKTIEQSLKNAEEIERRLQETNEEIDKKLAKATEAGQEIVVEAQKMRDQIVDEARQKAIVEAEAIFKKGQEALKMEKERMMGEVRAEISALVVAVFNKVTGKTLTKEDQKKIIEREVRNLS